MMMQGLAEMHDAARKQGVMEGFQIALDHICAAYRDCKDTSAAETLAVERIIAEARTLTTHPVFVGEKEAAS
jgi:hypothetical protein